MVWLRAEFDFLQNGTLLEMPWRPSYDNCLFSFFCDEPTSSPSELF
jgi:hypothetical protein